MTNRNDLLSALNRLLSAQFSEVLTRYGFPAQNIRTNLTQSEQAMDLLRYAEQHENGLMRLADIVTELIQPTHQIVDKAKLMLLKSALFDCMETLGAETMQNLGSYLKQVEKHGLSSQQMFNFEVVEHFLLQKTDALPTEQFIQFCQSELFQSTLSLDYTGLVRRLQFGDVALFLGLDAMFSSLLPQQFFDNLKNTCDYADFHSLPEACEYLQIHSGRGFLVDTLQQLLGSANPVSTLYNLLAQVEKSLLIIYAGYDDLLEHALIYRIRGLYRNSDQEWLVLSEQDYVDFVRNSKMPDYIVSRLDRRSLWFLGHHPSTWEDRMLVNAVLEKRRRDADITLAIHKDADKFARMHWEKRNHVNNYALDLQEFVAELQRHLEMAKGAML